MLSLFAMAFSPWHFHVAAAFDFSRCAMSLAYMLRHAFRWRLGRCYVIFAAITLLRLLLFRFSLPPLPSPSLPLPPFHYAHATLFRCCLYNTYYVAYSSLAARFAFRCLPPAMSAAIPGFSPPLLRYCYCAARLISAPYSSWLMPQPTFAAFMLRHMPLCCLPRAFSRCFTMLPFHALPSCRYAVAALMPTLLPLRFAFVAICRQYAADEIPCHQLFAIFDAFTTLQPLPLIAWRPFFLQLLRQFFADATLFFDFLYAAAACLFFRHSCGGRHFHVSLLRRHARCHASFIADARCVICSFIF